MKINYHNSHPQPQFGKGFSVPLQTVITHPKEEYRPGCGRIWGLLMSVHMYLFSRYVCIVIIS